MGSFGAAASKIFNCIQSKGRAVCRNCLLFSQKADQGRRNGGTSPCFMAGSKYGGDSWGRQPRFWEACAPCPLHFTGVHIFFWWAPACYKNFLGSDLEAGACIGKLWAELAQNGHGFLCSRTGAVNLTQLLFKRAMNLRAWYLKLSFSACRWDSLWSRARACRHLAARPNPRSGGSRTPFAACKAMNGKTDAPPQPPALFLRHKIED